ncbi:MAG: MBL fold metallo-hydrolase [Nannocystaceae bacterium]
MRRPALALLLALLPHVGACAAHPVDLAAAPEAAVAPCGGPGVRVQILGSGGPIADDARASSGALIWIDGEARALVDCGGGVFLRFAQSGADLEDLEVVVLTHLHVDHSVDLPALLKSASFGGRRRPLTIVGPAGGDDFPGVREFVDATMGPRGAYRYLGYLGDDPPFPLEVIEVAVEGEGQRLDRGGLALSLAPAPHGVVPALGVRVDVGDRAIAFTGDQRLDDRRFLDRIRGVDLLVANHAIPEGAGPAARSLHATPSAIGAAAHESGARHLVLAHHMARSLRDLDGGLAEIRRRYRGPITVAEDLTCAPIE